MDALILPLSIAWDFDVSPLRRDVPWIAWIVEKRRYKMGQGSQGGFCKNQKATVGVARCMRGIRSPV